MKQKKKTLKYIVVGVGIRDRETAIVFDWYLQHSEIAKGFENDVKILGAGFCKLTPKVYAYGMSGTLGIASRREVDAAVIAKCMGLA